VKLNDELYAIFTNHFSVKYFDEISSSFFKQEETVNTYFGE
jgi:hypothetical protein